MHTYPLSEYMHFVRANDWQGVADMMLSSAEKLAGAGADFAICPDNTIHQAFDRLVNRSPIPWLHIAEEVARVAKQSQFSKVGVLGTQYLMEGPVYPAALGTVGIRCETPDESECRQINQIIFDELVYGRFDSASREAFKRIINNLRERGCDAVVLGCTEIPLLISQEDSSLPVLDSTRILARAALARATQSVARAKVGSGEA